MLKGCYSRVVQQRCCSSNLNSLSKVTFILNKDTEIINFLVWFIV